MGKNIIILVLFALVVIMFVANLSQARKLFEQTKQRVKHQLDLANVVEATSNEANETSTGPDTNVSDRPGNEQETPSVVA